MVKTSLNKAQQEAVSYLDGPLLIVAGAGTGKTTVITEKIAHIVNTGNAKPEDILALTFTDKAAGEMADRVDRLLNNGYLDLHISTFHTFCQRLLERYGLHIGLPTSFKLLTETDAWLLVRSHLYDFRLDYYRPLGNPSKHIHELLKHFSKCKDELISPEEYLAYAESLRLDTDSTVGDEKTRLEEIANAYHTYNQLLLNNNALDFGDLIYYTVKLLEKRPQILTLLQERFRFILVDEFQDVNWAQYHLVRLLTGEKTQLTVVGDDDQSIYAFRGASVSNILRFKTDFPKAKEIVLNENYRSGQKILDLAYASIQHNNPDRLEVKLGIDKALRAGGGIKEGAVTHFHGSTLDDEVRRVVEEILTLKEQTHCAWDDFAILVRANNHAEPFLAALEAARIPYEFLASSGLYRQPIVLDCINFFKIINDYHESGAIYRLLRLPFFACTENDVQKFTTMAKKKSTPYYEALKRASEFHLSAEGIQICERLLSLVHEGMRQARQEKPSLVLYHFLEKSGYLSYLAHEEEKGNQHMIRQIYQLQQLFETLKQYEMVIPDATVASFLDHYREVTLAGDAGELHQPEDTPDSVNILTIHGSKGLEFRYVFLVNMVEDRFPSRSRSDAIEIPLPLIKEQLPEGDGHLEEERRLFYVGITRAKERLYLTSAEGYGGVRKKKMSRFLMEVGFDEKKQEKGTATTQWKTQLAPKRLESAEGGIVYELPGKFSFSQIKSYQTCPYQYKLAHILKIPTRGTASFSFGQSMHATLQEFYERIQELNQASQGSLFGNPAVTIIESNVKVPPLEELLDMYEKKWIPDWYENKRQREEYYEKGKEILKVFYASHEGNWTIPVSLESWFKIKVGEYIVHGRIDRIDKLADGTLEIIDYKTGQAKEKVTGEEKDQLLIYQIAVETLPEYKSIGKTSKLTFYYLNDNIRTSFIGEGDDIERLQERLKETMNSIQKGQFT
ncbi:MAG TPA: ATP-dependent DNA helicase, partial [Candidatus Kapabacteria bacterium]|nr:ATP-dependent DNA helicase [Candidatus Kapabacteria bacterium]